jgi:hypothetical protein
VEAWHPPAREWSGLDGECEGAEVPPASSWNGEVIARARGVLGLRRTRRSGSSGSTDYDEMHLTGAVIGDFALGGFRPRGTDKKKPPSSLSTRLSPVGTTRADE